MQVSITLPDLVVIAPVFLLADIPGEKNGGYIDNPIQRTQIILVTLVSMRFLSINFTSKTRQ